MTNRVKYVRKFWHRRALNHAEDAQKFAQMRRERQQRLDELILVRQEALAPSLPGPKSLNFVNEGIWEFSVMAVIIANFVMDGVLVLHPELSKEIDQAQQWFLLFYVV